MTLVKTLKISAEITTFSVYDHDGTSVFRAGHNQDWRKNRKEKKNNNNKGLKNN